MHACLTATIDKVEDRQSATRQRVEHEAQIAADQANGRLRSHSERRRELQFIQKVTQDFTAPPDPVIANAAVLGEWRDCVRTIPDIRSALLPLNQSETGIEWSKAFSLPKADLEPWVSFLNGYQASSLFTAATRPVHTDPSSQQPALQLQFEVQAILELRGLAAQLILEPPVQISSPAEYLDLIAELEACRDQVHATELAKICNEVHASRLEQAVEKGREMGDRLYHALLGPDFINLAREWEKRYQRKPSVDEMYCMLTRGCVKVVAAKRPAPTERRAPQHQPTAGAPARQIVADRPRETIEAKAAPAQFNTDMTNRKAESVARQIAEETCKSNRKRKILLHLFHFAVCCAALATHAFVV